MYDDQTMILSGKGARKLFLAGPLNRKALLSPEIRGSFLSFFHIPSGICILISFSLPSGTHAARTYTAFWGGKVQAVPVGNLSPRSP